MNNKPTNGMAKKKWKQHSACTLNESVKTCKCVNCGIARSKHILNDVWWDFDFSAFDLCLYECKSTQIMWDRYHLHGVYGGVHSCGWIQTAENLKIITGLVGLFGAWMCLFHHPCLVVFFVWLCIFCVYYCDYNYTPSKSCTTRQKNKFE